jgi:type IVB pilus formation R64 PilN family outer membrane protein
LNLKKSAALTALLCLSACSGLYGKMDNQFPGAQKQLSGLVKDVGNTAPGVVDMATPAVVHQDGIWLGKNVVKVRAAVLPNIFYEPATFERSVSSLSELAERLTLRSGIPIKLSPDAVAIAAGVTGTGTAAKQPTQAQTASALTSSAAITGAAGLPLPTVGAVMAAGGTRAGSGSSSITIAYANGNFKGLLDTVASRFGVYWKYDNGAVQFYHTDSRSFQINAIPGDSAFKATVTSGSTSTGGDSGSSGGSGSGVNANNSQNTAVTSQLSVFSGIEKAVSAMLSSYGKVVSSPATGTLTVVDTPDILERVGAFIESENRTLMRQVVINVTVLSVTLSDEDSYGINWSLLYSTLSKTFGISNTVTSATGAVSLSAGILSTSSSRLAGSSMVISALSEQGKVQRKTTASVVTLNNQPVPVQVAKQTSYLKSSQSTVTALVGTSTTLTPGTVTSGFNMSILPHVLNNGTVLLQFSTDISSLRTIRSITSNNSTIEMPELDTRNFLQRVSMKSNETLIISGFEQSEDDLTKQGVGSASNFVLGGGFTATKAKEIIVILVTPSTSGNGI